MKLLPLELAVLSKLLEGDIPLLQALRVQLTNCSVVQREFTGCGFYTTLSTSADATRIPHFDAKFGDVIADIAGLANGAGFLLFIKDGLLDMLEGYSFDEPWPLSTDVFTLKFNNDSARDWGNLTDFLNDADKADIGD